MVADLLALSFVATLFGACSPAAGGGARQEGMDATPARQDSDIRREVGAGDAGEAKGDECLLGRADSRGVEGDGWMDPCLEGGPTVCECQEGGTSHRYCRQLTVPPSPSECNCSVPRRLAVECDAECPSSIGLHRCEDAPEEALQGVDDSACSTDKDCGRDGSRTCIYYWDGCRCEPRFCMGRADCPTGQRCLCRSRGIARRNICVQEECGPERPCVDGHACIYSVGLDIGCCASCRISGAYCATDLDECIPGLSCGEGANHAVFDKICAYSTTEQRWTCSPIHRCECD